jgi:hypothetical protein
MTPQTKIGKLIGGSLYVHRDYVKPALQQNFPGPKVEELYLNALDAIQNMYPEHPYVVVKITPVDKQVAFIASPDFDTADEPISGDSYLVKPDMTVKLTHQARDPWIYHGKHLMVGPDYKGFKVDEAEEWYNYWNRELKESHTRIGKKSVWNKIKPKKKLTHSEIRGIR